MKSKLSKAALDLGLLAGGAAFVYGLHLAWSPLGFIAGGLLLAGGCFFAGYEQQRRELLDRIRKGGSF